ncbi:hypothetical protein ACJX0J_024850, partial [Zea mays]
TVCFYFFFGLPECFRSDFKFADNDQQLTFLCSTILHTPLTTSLKNKKESQENPSK